MNALTLVLALFITAYGFLLVIGGGPRSPNQFSGAIAQTFGRVIGGFVRMLIQLLLTALGWLTEFVFNRPRR